MTALRQNPDGNSSSANGDAGRSESNVRQAMVAVDLGAASCRVSLLRWVKGQPQIRLVHRFLNAPQREQGSLRWDLSRIYDGVEEGLRACAELAPEGIAAIGVDGWAIDYVRLDPTGQPIANPFCYRDERNVAAAKAVHDRISAARLYELTGVQILPLNTLYQLYADSSQGDGQRIAQRAPWANLPEYVLYRLGGKRVSEYTNATHTQLLALANREWCPEIFKAAGLEIAAAPPVVPPGSDIGRVEGALAWLPAFRDTRLIASACHDTAAAIAGIPAHGDDWAFISSGTWSLVGCVLDLPCVSDAAMDGNFSNEGGVGGKINFLKNVNGMWLLQQCTEQWHSQGHPWTLQDLLEECATLPRPRFLLDVDDPDLLLPGNMPARINAQLRRAGQALVSEQPALAPTVANLIFHSLAARYATVLRDVSRITGRHFKRVYIVGGASANALLNRLTEQASGLEVWTGSCESATLGNFAVQLAALAGDFGEGIGVSAAAVAKWAGVLAEPPGPSLRSVPQMHSVLSGGGKSFWQ